MLDKSDNDGWLYHQILVPIFETDGSGWVTHANAAFSNLLGRSYDAIDGQDLAEFMTEAAGAEHRRHLLSGAPRSRDVETQFKSNTGGVIDVMLSMSSVMDVADGSMLGIVIDLTMQRLVDRPAEERAELLGSVAEYASDAILITEAVSSDGSAQRVMYANPAFSAMTGYQADEIVGKTPRILQGPKTSRSELDRVRAAIAQQLPVRVELVNYTKEGAEFDVELDIASVANADGQVTHWIAIQRDITARRNSERERMRSLVEQNAHLVWRARNDGLWTWSSQQWAEFTGQTRSETQGKGWLDAVHPDDRDIVERSWDQAVALGALDIEFRLRRATDGAFIWHQMRAVPVLEQAGHVAEWIGTTTNIQALKVAQHQRNLLLRELQHRTRNQLAVVQSIIQMTIKQSKTLRGFSKVYAGRLGALSRVQGLLSRAEFETLDLQQLVEAELSAHGEVEPNRLRVGGPSVQLTGSAMQALALALHELATNAVKFGALGQPLGSLSVLWRLENSAGKELLVIEWIESGVVMPEAEARNAAGFGMELIRRALPYQLDGTTDVAFKPDGIACIITMPAGRV